jgi:hypothetical protein
MSPRRAFALPVVLVFVLVAGLVSAVMLERQSAQSLATRRELERYRAHHMRRGLVEVLDGWVSRLNPANVPEQTGENGHALDILLEDGSRIEIALREAQGSILTVVSERTRADEAAIRGIAGALARIAEESGRYDEAWVRKVGPAAVSVHTAPEEVLRAVVAFATDGDGRGDSLVTQLVRDRRSSRLREVDIVSAANRAGLAREAQLRVRQLVSALPVLWEMEVSVYPPPFAGLTPRVERRYRSLVQLDVQRAGRGMDLRRLIPGDRFLTWDEVPVE